MAAFSLISGFFAHN